MNEAIIKLQEIISHQSEDIARLSDEMYTQQKELAELNARLTKITAKLESMQEIDNIRTPEQESPPPHY